MADVSKTTESLKFDFLYVDGDTNTLTLKNPKQNITTSDIEELQAYMRQTNVLIGDKASGTFGRIDAVTKVAETRTYLDFS